MKLINNLITKIIILIVMVGTIIYLIGIPNQTEKQPTVPATEIVQKPPVIANNDEVAILDSTGELISLPVDIPDNEEPVAVLNVPDTSTTENFVILKPKNRFLPDLRRDRITIRGIGNQQDFAIIHQARPLISFDRRLFFGASVNESILASVGITPIRIGPVYGVLSIKSDFQNIVPSAGLGIDVFDNLMLSFEIGLDQNPYIGINYHF